MQVIEDPRVGTLLAGYRLEALLGRGGMSVVYLAEDVRLKRKVAVKLLAAHLAEDESFRERFLHESELAASIDHPNIIPIYEAGEFGELLFIAMRYVEGSDLKGRLRKGPLDPSQAIGVLGQVASALDAAHARSEHGPQEFRPSVRAFGAVRHRRGGAIHTHTGILDSSDRTQRTEPQSLHIHAGEVRLTTEPRHLAAFAGLAPDPGRPSTQTGVG
jgi:serine/threonine protein kinase